MQTSDGGYVFAGETAPKGIGNKPFTEFWLVKTNAAGVMEWNQTYGGDAGYDEACSVKQTSDGGYILAGYTDKPYSDRNDRDFRLVKTNSAGSKEWNQV